MKAREHPRNLPPKLGTNARELRFGRLIASKLRPLVHFSASLLLRGHLRLDVSCKIKLHSSVDDLPDPRSVWFR